MARRDLWFWPTYIFWLLLLSPLLIWAQLDVLVRLRRRHRAVLAHLTAGLRSAGSLEEALEPVAPGVFEVQSAWLARATAASAGTAEQVEEEPSPRRVVVVHLLGACENRWSPLAGLERMAPLQPDLAEARHLILDTPALPELLGSIPKLVERYWDALEGALPDGALEVVVVGLNRGALVALPLASRIAGRWGARVAVLGFGLPATGEMARAPAVRVLTTLRFPIERLSYDETRLPMGLRTRWRRTLRGLYAFDSSYVLGELGMDTPALLDWTVHDLRQRHPFESSLRAVRELTAMKSLRGAALERALEVGIADTARDSRVGVWLLWGGSDAWQRGERQRRRVEQLVAQRPGEEGERFCLRVLEGHNHGVCRVPGPAGAELAALCGTALEWARLRPRRSSSRPPPSARPSSV